MISRLEKFRQRRHTTIVLFSALWIAIIFFVFYGISGVLSSSGGTFAWFTSQTEASGSIQNASTNDLLDIQASEIQYKKNCTLGNSLSITNISQQDTTVTVSLITEKGDKILTEKHLNPGEFLSTNLNDSNDLTQKCKIDKIIYRIQAFTNFVNEFYTVAVDKNKLLASIENVKNDQGVNIESNKETENDSDIVKDSVGIIDIKKEKNIEKNIDTNSVLEPEKDKDKTMYDRSFPQQSANESQKPVNENSGIENNEANYYSELDKAPEESDTHIEESTSTH